MGGGGREEQENFEDLEASLIRFGNALRAHRAPKGRAEKKVEDWEAKGVDLWARGETERVASGEGLLALAREKVADNEIEAMEEFGKS